AQFFGAVDLQMDVVAVAVVLYLQVLADGLQFLLHRIKDTEVLQAQAVVQYAGQRVAADDHVVGLAAPGDVVDGAKRVAYEVGVGLADEQAKAHLPFQHRLLGALLHISGKFAAHDVETALQKADLIVGIDLHAQVQIVFDQGAHGAGEFHHGPRQPPGDDEQTDQREEKQRRDQQ